MRRKESAVGKIFVYTGDTMKILVKSMRETRTAAERFLRDVAEKHNGRHAFVAGLSGNLGAGKTAFTKACAAATGIKETVTSPTFVLERVYKIPKRSILAKKFDHFVHIDAYRLSGAKELAHLGWKELTENPRNIIFVEWPEIVANAIPKDAIIVKFEHIDEKTRRIEYPKN